MALALASIAARFSAMASALAAIAKALASIARALAAIAERFSAMAMLFVEATSAPCRDSSHPVMAKKKVAMDNPAIMETAVHTLARVRSTGRISAATFCSTSALEAAWAAGRVACSAARARVSVAPASRRAS